MRMRFVAPMTAVIVCMASVFVIPQVLAGEALSLAKALEKTLKQGPALQDYPYQLRINEAQQLQAALTPNPELAVNLENIAGSGGNQGLKNAELTLTLSQLIEMGNKRNLRLQKSQWQQTLVQQQFEVSRLDALANTTRSYIRQVELQHLRQLLLQRLVREEYILMLANQRAAASNLSDADVNRIELRLIRSKLELGALDNALELGRSQLAAHWAQPADFTQVQGAFSELPLLPSLHELQGRLEQSPLLAKFVTRQRLHETELSLAKAQQSADITVSAGVRRIESVNDTAIVLGFSMPWQRQDPSAAAQLAAKAEMALSQLQQQQTHTALRLLVQQIYLELAQLREYVKVLQSTLIPKALQLQHLSEQAYQQGQLDLFALLSAEQELRQAETDLVSAQSRFHLQLLELERLTGQAFTVSGPVSLSFVE